MNTWDGIEFLNKQFKQMDMPSLTCSARLFFNLVAKTDHLGFLLCSTVELPDGNVEASAQGHCCC